MKSRSLNLFVTLPIFLTPTTTTSQVPTAVVVVPADESLITDPGRSTRSTAITQSRWAAPLPILVAGTDVAFPPQACSNTTAPNRRAVIQRGRENIWLFGIITQFLDQ